MTRLTRANSGLPFRLGTTSYIIPDEIVPNVQFLGPLVDDVELVQLPEQEPARVTSGKLERR